MSNAAIVLLIIVVFGTISTISGINDCRKGEGGLWTGFLSFISGIVTLLFLIAFFTVNGS